MSGTEIEDIRTQLKQKFEEVTKIMKADLETVLRDYRCRHDERVAEIEGKLRESEAAVAAMRETLQRIASWDPPGSDSAANWLSETCRRGLASDAGALLLVEIKKLRRERDELQERSEALIAGALEDRAARDRAVAERDRAVRERDDLDHADCDAMYEAFIKLSHLVGSDCPAHQVAGFQFDCDACAAKNEGNEWIAIMRAALGRA